jgi:hypothetical protein
VPGAQQIGGNGRAHVAQSDEPDLHVPFLHARMPEA